ncbi:hypothetical protein L4D76_12535 [Photobacterium sagamiensis]|uniref:hypothetical protein n=1 Tax=Photobacterium sagamiensis TaxID=2910241 RepID=UPI003D114CB3
MTEPKKGYSLRLRNSHYRAPEALDVEQNNEVIEDVLPASKLTHTGKYLSVFTKEFGLQLVFFLLTIFACSQYFFFVEETTVASIRATVKKSC